MEEMEQGVIAQDYTKRLKRNVKMGEWNDNILFLGGFILAGAAAIGGVITYLISKIRWASLNYQLDMEYGKRNLSKHAEKTIEKTKRSTMFQHDQSYRNRG